MQAGKVRIRRDPGARRIQAARRWLGCILVCVALPVSAQPEAEPLVFRAFQEVEAGNHAEALRLFQDALEREPGSSELLTYVGLGQFKNERYAEALDAFDRAKQRDPTILDAAFLFYRADSLRALGLGSLERDAWEELIEWDAQSSFAALARVALDENRPVDDTTTDEWVNVGLSHIEERPHTARAYFLEALRMEGSAKESHVAPYLAMALNQCGESGRVLRLRKDLDAASELQPLWLLQVAVAYMGQEHWKEAGETLKAVPADSEVGSQASYLHAVCLVRRGLAEEARTALETLRPTAGSLETEIDDLLRSLGSVQESTN